MRRIHLIAASISLTALLVTSAAAQTPPGTSSGAAPAATVTVPTGSLQKAQDAWRGRALIGTPVFNENGQRVATISDLLITDEGAVEKVVLAVTRRGKLVAIPFSQLHFVPSQSLGTPVGRRARHLSHFATDIVRPFGVMLPGATADSLASMDTFRFLPAP